MTPLGAEPMDQHRWKTVNHIFHAALDLSPNERQEFVKRASGGDTAVAEEVNRLLKADVEAGSFLAKPLIEASGFRSEVQTWSVAAAPGVVLCRRFRVERLVGEGGMGRVFEAFDMELGVKVALKMIRPGIAENDEALARFRHEVRLARRITHPNVCRTFDLERDVPASGANKGEIVFLKMEFLEGETLARRITREGALPLDEALEVARQVAAGLEAAQSLGVVHRDIKPGNIMLVPDQGNFHGVRAVITDFGLARAIGMDALRTLSEAHRNACL